MSIEEGHTISIDTYGLNYDRPKQILLLSVVFKSRAEIVISKGEQLIDLVDIDDTEDSYHSCAHNIKVQRESYLRYYISSIEPFL